MKLLSFIIHSFILSICIANAQNTSQWKKMTDYNGITIYETDSTDRIKKFKAEFEIESSLSGAVCFLKDVESYKKWISRVDNAFLLKTIDDSIYYYHYFIIVEPIVKKDGIVRSTISQDNKTKIVYFRSHSDTTIKEIEGYDRINDFGNKWQFTPYNQNHLKVKYIGYGDVHGKFTYFFIRRIILSGLYSTFDNMRKLVSSEEYQTKKLSFIEEK